jgi:glycosyltransferase involved in cell wall biosynthesis
MGRGNPALLIALPSGLTTGGVQTWAARLSKSLSDRGVAVGVLTHDGHGHAETAQLGRYAQRFSLHGLPPLDQCDGNLSAYLPAYRQAVGEMARRAGGPVVVSPNLVGDCYGIFAHLTREIPELIRLVGWCHCDIPYDLRILEHYAPVLHRFVAVSEHLKDSLRARLVSRAADVLHVPYGVEVPDCPPPRQWYGPIRIIYAGRLEESVKRVMCLPAMSRALSSLGLEHRISIVGDGPARVVLEEACRGLPIELLGPQSNADVADLFSTHDVFALPSRAEGLSVAMLEAMAQGCVPVVTRIDSGAGEALDQGRNGVLVEVEPDAGAVGVGRCMAAGVAEAVQAGLPRLAESAWRMARERYSLEVHAARVEVLVREVASEPARQWPAPADPAFTRHPGGGPSATVPAVAAGRLAAVLSGLAGRRVALHGTGRHTRELAAVIEQFPATVVAFTDDDPSRRGGRVLGLPVVAPDQAAPMGITDVVISSWINEEPIWKGRFVYERRGIRVHRLYGAGALAA